MSGTVPGPDGRQRCPWAVGTPDMLVYHDEEWGHPILSDQAVFERMSLEAMQSGLSWLIVLRKRDSMRRAFAGFDIDALASFGPADVDRLLADPGVIRNRRKIEAVITNASIAASLPNGLAAVVAEHAPKPRPRPEQMTDIASTSEESAALAKTLRKAGMSFVGPTTLHALFQAGGWVDDHLRACETAPPR